MKSKSGRVLALATFLGLAFAILPSIAQAQSYSLKKLTAIASGANHTDPLLQNAWGLVYGPSQPFWVSDENDGWSTLYDGAGNPQTLQVLVPTYTGSGSG